MAREEDVLTKRSAFKAILNPAAATLTYRARERPLRVYPVRGALTSTFKKRQASQIARCKTTTITVACVTANAGSACCSSNFNNHNLPNSCNGDIAAVCYTRLRAHSAHAAKLRQQQG